MGVDGLRLDAVPYLYEREGTNCENLPETHAFLKKLRAHIDAQFPDRMLLAEANQWPEDAVAYFGDGDECHMAFHFPLMPRLFMALRMEDRFPIIDILAQTPAIPDNCQWALFLRNHDELTLEMVTDEERDYMYRAYAHDPQARINLGIRRRLAPLLGQRPPPHRADERRCCSRCPARRSSTTATRSAWATTSTSATATACARRCSGAPTATPASRAANPQQLYLPVIIDPEYHYEAVNVEAQQHNPHSLLWWMKRLIALRKRHQAFGRGTLEFLHPENRKVLAFLRRLRGRDDPRRREPVALRAVRRARPVARSRAACRSSCSGGPRSRAIGERAVLPHARPARLLLVRRSSRRAPARDGGAGGMPTLALDRGRSTELAADDADGPLAEGADPQCLPSRRWFRGKARDDQGRPTRRPTRSPCASPGARPRS